MTSLLLLLLMVAVALLAVGRGSPDDFDSPSRQTDYTGVIADEVNHRHLLIYVKINFKKLVLFHPFAQKLPLTDLHEIWHSCIGEVSGGLGWRVLSPQTLDHGL